MKATLTIDRIPAVLVTLLEAKSFKKEHCYFLARLASGVKRGWTLTPAQLEASKKLLDEHYSEAVKLVVAGKPAPVNPEYVTPAPKPEKAKAKKTPKVSKAKKPDIEALLLDIARRLEKLESR